MRAARRAAPRRRRPPEGEGHRRPALRADRAADAGASPRSRPTWPRPTRMLRLLQGDVGAGKTVVAMLALLGAVEAGAQGALMAPTEILARQHMASLEPLAKAAGVRMALLTGRERGRRATRRSPRWRRARSTSWSARMRCSPRTSRSPISASPWSTNSTASACISACSCRARAAPRRCAGDDRDADPAHAGAHRLWRHGRLAPHRPPAGPQAGRDARALRRAARRSGRASAQAPSPAARAPIGCARWSRSPRRSTSPPPKSAPRCCKRVLGSKVGLVHGR